MNSSSSDIFANNPQLIATITQAVLKHLSSNRDTNDNLPYTQGDTSQSTNGQQDPAVVRHLSDTVIRQSLATPTSDGSTLSRTSSTLSRTFSNLSRTSSNASTISSASCSRTLTFDQGERPTKRKRSPPQEQDDMNVVRRPVLEELDAQYLASKTSRLFRFGYRKKRGPNGDRVLKKYPDLVLPLFKTLVRPILRRLLGQVNVHGDPATLYNRYYQCIA